ncbi:MAG: hypothetical protein B6D35_13815 [Candidatus Brocadia sp. UTAMX2]|nr:MAG: hypothetical protein B6D35_13815 [Candidatus Brocadia sp. UTAMX2]
MNKETSFILTPSQKTLLLCASPDHPGLLLSEYVFSGLSKLTKFLCQANNATVTNDGGANTRCYTQEAHNL